MKKVLPFIIVIVILVVISGGVYFMFGKEKNPDVHEDHNKTNQIDNKDNDIDTNTSGEVSTVYMTTNLSSESLIKIYEQLDVTLPGKVGIKVSTGEAGGNNYLKKELIGDLVSKLNGTIVENNTAYGGSRGSTAIHKQTARDHGWYDIADVDIMDEDGSTSLPIANGKHLEENLVGSHFNNYDSYLVLSHFKGHSMAGFGGAIKNMSIGFASSSGKLNIHSAGSTTSSFNWNTPQDDFLESMAEAAKTIVEAKGENILYINVLNRLSVDCDCDSNPAEPDMHDIGILASTDPVALDQASVDLIYKASDGASLVRRIESRNGLHVLNYADEIGLGNQDYRLVSIDD